MFTISLEQLAAAIYAGLEQRFGFILDTDNLAMQAACLDPRYGGFEWLPDKYKFIMNQIHHRYVVLVLLFVRSHVIVA